MMSRSVIYRTSISLLGSIGLISSLTSLANINRAISTASVHDILRAPSKKNNINEGIIDKVGRKLHLQPNHPLQITKKM